MRNRHFLPFLVLQVLATGAALPSLGQSPAASSTSSVPGPIFAKGQPAPTANFTGQAWVQGLVGKEDKYPCGAGSVQFAPGARSHWHQHPAGQILLIVEGTAYYQEKGQARRVFHKGDVIKAPAGVEHWHGAGPTTTMTHVAINPDIEAVPVVWGRAVTQAEYLGKP